MSQGPTSSGPYNSSSSGGFFPQVYNSDGLASSDGAANKAAGQQQQQQQHADAQASSGSSYPAVYRDTANGQGPVPASAGYSSPSYATSTTGAYTQGSTGQPVSGWSGIGSPSSLNAGTPYAMSSVNTTATGGGHTGSGGFAPPSSSNGTATNYNYNTTISSGGTLPVPQMLSSNTSSALQGGGSAGAVSYPAMAPGLHPPMQHAPMSCPPSGNMSLPMSTGGQQIYNGLIGQQQSSSVGVPPSSMSSAYGSAGPQAANMAAAALAGVQQQGPAPPGAAAVSAAPPLVRPSLGEDLCCTCPMVCIVGTNHGAPHAVPLHIMSLQYNVQCLISQAFVQLQLVAHYPLSWNDAPLVFFLPKTTDTTITELCIENTVRPSVFATAIVPLDDMKRLGPGRKGAGSAAAGPDPEDEASQDPEMFMLALPPGLPGDQYRVKLSYFHPMSFDLEAGRYMLRLPTMVPQVCLPQGSSVNSVLDINVEIKTGGGEEVDLLSWNHPVAITDTAPGTIIFQLDANQLWENSDFFVGYKVWRDQMTATVHVEAPQPGQPDQRGTFALSVTPPGPENSISFPRSVVFMFDRSGSMTGDPIRYAKAALLTGLHMLGPQDVFTVVAFDHEQLWWTDRLIEATPENVLTCMRWVQDDLTARGTTDINAPLQRALKMLSGAQGLPFVFLLTDGCVDDEIDICKMAESFIAGAARPADPNSIIVTADGGNVTVKPQLQQQQQLPGQPPVLAPRIYTFGIGPFCNHYFLKRLAAIGRGMNDVAFRPHAIQAVMERMLAAAALPMLSDVQISVQGLTAVELYPFPIPDVFVGQPLLVCGKFEGDWPEQVEICGILPDGSSWVQSVPSLAADGLPLQKIFAKSQLDLMTANAWMAGNPANLVQQIVDLSMASNVVSAHTAMLGFETTPERFEQMQSVPPNERRKKVIRWAIGGAAGIVAVAGVAAALTFGDIAATLSNAPVADVMGGVDLGGVFEGLEGALDCCGGGCDCCGDCGDLCGACMTC